VKPFRRLRMAPDWMRVSWGTAEIGKTRTHSRESLNPHARQALHHSSR
jgi:hypothetical protein